MDKIATLQALQKEPLEDRLELLLQLWDQLLDEGWNQPFDEQRKTELNRRWENFLAHPESGLTWEQVAAEVRFKHCSPSPSGG